MLSKPQKPKRWRRHILRWFGIAALIIFVGIPTVIAIRTRLRVVSALRSASAVRLEEYAFDETLTTRALAPAEYQHVRDALPISPDMGIPGIMAMCFIPHHRIVITDAGHHEVRFDICFTCDQVALSDNDIVATPYLWRYPLRRLFTRHNIPIRDEYAYLPDPERQ